MTISTTCLVRQPDRSERSSSRLPLPDLQMVSITLRILSRPDVEHLPKIYQNLGLDYDERVLPSIANEILKAIVAQHNAAELIEERELVRSPAPRLPSIPCPLLLSRLTHVLPYALGLLPQVSARIRQELLKRAKEFNIRLEDVSIVNLTFGQEFTRAVEQKQIAQQDAERAKYIVEMVRSSLFPSTFRFLLTKSCNRLTSVFLVCPFRCSV